MIRLAKLCLESYTHFFQLHFYTAWTGRIRARFYMFKLATIYQLPTEINSVSIDNVNNE